MGLFRCGQWRADGEINESVLTTDWVQCLVDYFRALFDHGDVMINKAIEQGVTRAYMSRKILVHNLGELTAFYNAELLPSNVWPPQTLLSITCRRLRELYNNI